MLITTSIRITGFAVGSIFRPAGAETFKEINYNLLFEKQRWIHSPNRLRNACLNITCDPDFQSCSIAQGEVSITMTDYERRRRVTRIWPLSKFPSIADMLHDDPDWWPTYPEDEEETENV